MRYLSSFRRALSAVMGGVVGCVFTLSVLQAQTTPTMVDRNLVVRTVVGGLAAPTTMAFLGADDFLVLEKETGKVQRVINGLIQSSPVLDLDVNFDSERGLLGIALHSNFPGSPWVYLYM